MGWHIDETRKYDLNELHRISLTGVVPTLFWVLPMGNWHRDELNDWWSFFTDRSDQYRFNHQIRLNSDNVLEQFGLILIKKSHINSSKMNVDLSELGKDLEKLRSIRESDNQDHKQILILAGSYPQPGWGLIIDSCDVVEFNNVVRGVINKPEYESFLQAIREATDSYYRLENLPQRPNRPNEFQTWGIEIDLAQESLNFLNEAENALNQNEYRKVGEKVIAALEKIKKVNWLEINIDSLQPFFRLQKTLVKALEVKNVSEEIFTKTIYPALFLYIEDPNNRQNILKNIEDKKTRDAMNACHWITGQGIDSNWTAFNEWAMNICSNHPRKISLILNELTGKVRDKPESFRGKKNQAEIEFNVTLKQWNNESASKRTIFHEKLEKVMTLHWWIGPQFLVDLELNIISNKSSISWDPARMIGWKITAIMKEKNFQLNELQSFVKKMEVPLENSISYDAHMVDGSVFTDYVHHVATSKVGFSPRAITVDLIAEFRIPDLKTLIQKFTSETETSDLKKDLAEKVVQALGWEEGTLDTDKKPLAGCIKTENEELVLLNSLNDLRKVLESLCKDIIDVIVAKLNYPYSTLIEMVGQNIYDYRWASRAKNWHEEISKIDLGRAVLIISGFFPTAFPDKKQKLPFFIATLEELRKSGNKDSHDNPKELKPKSSDVAKNINNLLKHSFEMFGELPWHMNVKSIHRGQPRILIGEAWSHGFPTTRLFKIIDTFGNQDDEKFLFWNPSRKNPVVPDPTFIRRPAP